MENRIVILFFLIAGLSFLFSGVSALLLMTRKCRKISCRGIVWFLFFLAAAVPFMQEQSLFSFKIFTDYTGGMRLELHNAVSETCLKNDLYITNEALRMLYLFCTLTVTVWIASAAAHITYGIAGYFNNLHFLTKHSEECHDDRIKTVFERAKKTAGIRRQITLRVMKRDIRLSPCTCGINFPAVYIGKDYLYSCSDSRLELVFLHELMHIRHHDTLLKLTGLITTSFYAFLPVSGKIRQAIAEDVEFRCDAAVLARMGDSVCGEYMAMILDAAEHNLRDTCPAPDFLSSVSRAGEMLIRRYHFMKERRMRKNNAVYLFPVLTAAAAVNMALFSVISVNNPDNMGIDFASPLLQNAVCSYLSIPDPHDITQNDVDSIYSIEFSLSDSRELLGNTIPEKYLMACTLNEGLADDGSAYSTAVEYGAEQKYLIYEPVPALLYADYAKVVYAGNKAWSFYLRSLYEEENGYIFLKEYDTALLEQYLQKAYKNRELDPFLANIRTADTRDIVLFRGLRTLIFSDKIKASEESVYESSQYAVISRSE